MPAIRNGITEKNLPVAGLHIKCPAHPVLHLECSHGRSQGQGQLANPQMWRKYSQYPGQPQHPQQGDQQHQQRITHESANHALLLALVMLRGYGRHHRRNHQGSLECVRIEQIHLCDHIRAKGLDAQRSRQHDAGEKVGAADQNLIGQRPDVGIGRRDMPFGVQSMLTPLAGPLQAGRKSAPRQHPTMMLLPWP